MRYLTRSRILVRFYLRLATISRRTAMPTMLRPTFLAPDEGLRLQSGPGRDLVFKVTGDDTGGAFDYFVVEVAPHGGPRGAPPPRRPAAARAPPPGGDPPRALR